MKGKKNLTKEEIETQIRQCREQLERNKDELIMAEIEGIYALLEDVVILMKEKKEKLDSLPTFNE